MSGYLEEAVVQAAVFDLLDEVGFGGLIGAVECWWVLGAGYWDGMGRECSREKSRMGGAAILFPGVLSTQELILY